MIDRLNDIRLFLEAARSGSFTAAGKRFNLSSAAASACIMRLETQLKTRLFVRTTRSLRLTEEGQMYREYCDRALQLFEQAELLLGQNLSEMSGPIRLSAPSDLGRNLLMTYLAEFRRHYPSVQVSLHLNDDLADLIGDHIDIALRYGSLPDSAMVARRLSDSRRLICASPELLARTGMPDTPNDLAGLPCIVLRTSAGLKNRWSYQADGRQLSVQLNRYIETNDGEVMRKWALEGQGFVRKSLPDVSADLKAGRLVPVLDRYFQQAVPLHAIYQSRQWQPPRFRLLTDFLQQQFALLDQDMQSWLAPAVNR